MTAYARKSESGHVRQGKSYKGAEKTLSLHLRLILRTETNMTIKKTKTVTTKKHPKTPANLGRGENLFSRIITLVDSNIQCSTTKKSQGTQKTRKLWHIQRKRMNQQTVPEKRSNGRYTRYTDIQIYNDFKTTISKMLKEIKGDVEKVKRTMCEQ